MAELRMAASSNNGDFRFSIEDGCVVLEMFDSDAEYGDDESKDPDNKADPIGPLENVTLSETYVTGYNSCDNDDLSPEDKANTSGIYFCSTDNPKLTPEKERSFEQSTKELVPDLDDDLTTDQVNLDLDMEVTEEDYDLRYQDDVPVKEETDQEGNVASVETVSLHSENSNNDSAFESMASDRPRECVSASRLHGSHSVSGLETSRSIENDATKPLSLHELFEQYRQGDGTQNATVDNSELQTSVPDQWPGKLPKEELDLSIKRECDVNVSNNSLSLKITGTYSMQPKTEDPEEKFIQPSEELKTEAIPEPCENTRRSPRHRKYTPPDRVQCDKCERWFAGTQSLNVHMRIHNNAKPYKCEVCAWRSRTSSAYNMHMKVRATIFSCLYLSII